MRCLAREPEERFENAAEVVAALRAPAPVPLPAVIAGRLRKKRAAAAIAGGILLVLLATGAIRPGLVSQLFRKIRVKMNNYIHHLFLQ